VLQPRKTKRYIPFLRLRVSSFLSATHRTVSARNVIQPVEFNRLNVYCPKDGGGNCSESAKVGIAALSKWVTAFEETAFGRDWIFAILKISGFDKPHFS